MKPLTYWEAKLTVALRELAWLKNLPDEIPDYPPKSVLRGQWRAAQKRWQTAQRRILTRRHNIKKLADRIKFFEGRIEVLTPTFWQKL